MSDVFSMTPKRCTICDVDRSFNSKDLNTDEVIMVGQCCFGCVRRLGKRPKWKGLSLHDVNSLHVLSALSAALKIREYSYELVE